MKRFIVFAVLGPSIGVIVLSAVSALSQGTLKVPTLFLGALALGYVMGLVPMLLVAVLDWWLERKDVGYRAAWCALFGFLVCSLLGHELTNAPSHFLTAAGIAGAISAAVCSWLSAKLDRQERTM